MTFLHKENDLWVKSSGIGGVDRRGKKLAMIVVGSNGIE